MKNQNHNIGELIFSIFFAIISAFNIGLGILQITKGQAFEEGVLTFTGGMNLICGIFILYVMIVLLIKKLHDREES